MAGRPFEAFRQDLRYGARLLRRSPGFALTAVTVIALGIGATTAAFTLLDHVLLRPLPFPRPEQLVRLYETELASGYARIEASPPNVADWRATSTSFSAMGAYSIDSVSLSGRGEPLRLDVGALDAGVLATLGVAPAIGRGFTDDDLRDGAPNLVLLGHGLAVTLFGDAASAVGGTLSLDQQPHTVIGVMAPGFAFPSRGTALWTPLRVPAEVRALRRNHLLDVIARLRPGVSLDQARADMTVIARQLERSYPNDNAGIGATVVDLRDVITPQSRLLVMAVFGAAVCLLLIACTNLANLLFARAVARRSEVAVRVAIGAARGRLIRQFLTESLLLATIGGGLGLALGAVLIPALTRLVPTALPVDTLPAADLRIFAFAALLTIATCVAFGAGPAWRSWRTADVQALRSRSAVGARTERVRSALVLVAMTGTVTLLVAAGLLVKALWRVQAVDPGFRTNGVVTLQTALPMPKYSADTLRRAFYTRVLADVRALPGVTSAAYTTALPLTVGAGILPVTVPGIADDPASAPRASLRFVTPDFFATLRIPLRAGRSVSDRDVGTAAPVTIISESLAGRLWPGQDPIGRTVNVATSDHTVVGVVGDIAVRGLERVSEPQMYFPADQLDAFLRRLDAPVSTFIAPKDLAVRASADPAALAPALREIVRRADPELAITNVRLLDDLVALQTVSRRSQLLVLSVFAAVAFVLAAIGIHGLLSFTVSARTQEVGVRVALGAERGAILRMFLRQGLVLGLGGIAVALPLAYASAHAMRALLFGVEPGDPLIYGSAILLVLLMTIAGSLRPALRAATIDPAVTIRSE